MDPEFEDVTDVMFELLAEDGRIERESAKQAQREGRRRRSGGSRMRRRS